MNGFDPSLEDVGMSLNVRGMAQDSPDMSGVDIDVGMGAGGGVIGLGDPRNVRAGPDVPDMPSPDVIAAIADQLNAAAAETQFGPGAAPNAVAVNQQGNRLSNAQVQALINLQDQYQTGFNETVPNTWDNPYVSQNYDDWGQAGTSNVNQDAISRAFANQGPDPVETRRQELMAELDRLNTLSVQASNVTQPYPSSWSQPDEWGMQDVRLDPLNPSPLTSVADYPGGDDWGMPNVGLTQASIAEGVMGAPGTYSGTVNPYDRARDASLAFDEYEMPSRQQQGVMRDIAQDDYMGTQPYNVGQGRLDQEGMGYYDNLVGSSRPSGRMDQEGAGYYDNLIGSSRPSGRIDQEGIGYYDNIAGGRTDREGGSFGRVDLETEEAAWRTVNDPDVDDYIEGKITAKELSGIKSEADLEKVVTDATKTLSKKLTKDEKKANVAARRKAEQSYVDFRDTLNFRVEIARSALATAENTHGKKSDEAKAAKRNVRNKEADLRMWERSDLYSKSYGKVNRPGMGQGLPFVGTALSMFASIEDYFHSLGKTERRSPEEVLKDMKDNPEKYERTGAEVSAAQLVRNMYPFLRKAPMDVAAAAAREPAYLRYLINLNVNKQPIPTSYSSNWKNDISDAWIYG